MLDANAPVEVYMKTFVAKPAEVERKWYVVDAEGKVRIWRRKLLPSCAVSISRSLHRMLIPAISLLSLMRKKSASPVTRPIKVYRRHSGYMGGLKEVSYKRMMDKHPERVIEAAVRGMLPKNTLGRAMYRKLKVYAGPSISTLRRCPNHLSSDWRGERLDG